MKAKHLQGLNLADDRVRAVASEMGLDFLPQEFDVVSEQKMLEIMAYQLPVNFSHWSFGRDYEIERTKHAHGYAVPYEVVFASDPVRAYLMESNPYPIQVLVMAHVYAHNDFMKHNRHFLGVQRDMISRASEAAARLRRYEQDYGLDEVERLLDAGLAIQWNVDPGEMLHAETEEQARERLYGWAQELPAEGRFDDLLPSRPEISREEKQELRLKTPPEPTVDLLGYVIAHSPRPLRDWQRDVLRTIKAEAQYFMPYRRTKIMNEGWATYWHEKIMQRLFAEGFLDAEQHGLYNLYNARVKAHHPREVNPYLLGYTIFQDIEERWDKGRFGPEYEENTDAGRRASWDLKLGQGRQKIFDVRRTHMDWFFLDEFLTQGVVEKLQLYLYLERDAGTHYESVIEETDWRKVRQILLRSLMNSGVPRVLVVDGNYRGGLQLYLRHAFEGLPLEEEYCRRTLEHVYYLWKRPVYLESQELNESRLRRKLYSCDERGVRVTLD
jgi:stage V sporulation protein R